MKQSTIAWGNAEATGILPSVNIIDIDEVVFNPMATICIAIRHFKDVPLCYATISLWKQTDTSSGRHIIE